jgi:hypothetical protein
MKCVIAYTLEAESCNAERRSGMKLSGTSVATSKTLLPYPLPRKGNKLS